MVESRTCQAFQAHSVANQNCAIHRSREVTFFDVVTLTEFSEKCLAIDSIRFFFFFFFLQICDALPSGKYYSSRSSTDKYFPNAQPFHIRNLDIAPAKQISTIQSKLSRLKNNIAQKKRESERGQKLFFFFTAGKKRKPLAHHPSK